MVAQTLRLNARRPSTTRPSASARVWDCELISQSWQRVAHVHPLIANLERMLAWRTKMECAYAACFCVAAAIAELGLLAGQECTSSTGHPAGREPGLRP
eukprot:14095823-Alexandrium_andersonii.AAC.1